MFRSFYLFILLSLSSCALFADYPYLLVMDGIKMTIPFEVKVGADSPEKQKELMALVDRVFEDVNQVYNNWNPDSEISQLNRLPALQKQKLSNQLAAFLKLCDSYVKATEGRFDPTVAPLHSLWVSSLENGSEPSKAELDEVSQRVGWHHIQLDGSYFSKDKEGVRIDLGGIAKGYAVDLLVDEIREAGFDSAYVSWGGETRCIGKHPTGRDWNVLVRFWEPIEEAKVLMGERAIATSGDYLQFWKVGPKSNERRYSHIIDVAMKRPIMIEKDSISSVSIVSDSCLKSDILATCGMLFESPQQALKWYQSKKKLWGDFDFWLFSHNPAINKKGSS
ncbi:MAG: FAD:protein FMN transferase [Chlamydiales bacterium]|nr:FAD:protein FMN transferase [Chlamydiales bacterium]